MTAVFEKHGLKFLFPENWKLLDHSDSDSPQVITLETPDGSATWSVHVYPPDADGDEILKETLATLQESYEDLEIAPNKQELGEFSATGVEAFFYCLDFLIRAQLHVVQTREHLLLLWGQAEDREFEKHHLVFQAISTSLLRSMSAE